MNWAPILGGTALAAFGLYMLVHALRSYRSAVASKRWPTTGGTLKNVHLWGTRNIGGEMKAVEKLSVQYEYTVGGTLHTGTTVSFYTLNYPETTDFADRHPEGSEVTVYYDPAHPARSTLVPGPRPGKPYSDLVIGSFGVIVGLLIATAGGVGIIG